MDGNLQAAGGWDIPTFILLLHPTYLLEEKKSKKSVFAQNFRWWRSGAGGERDVPQLAENEPGHGQPFHSLLGLGS